jgi:predicted enzyme related to lactoylglutathione lyase
VIDRLGFIIVTVKDAMKSANWYKEKLGFDIRSADGHWVTVSPRGSTTVIHLCDGVALRRDTGIVLYTADVTVAYERLRSMGVEFVQAPKRMEWGLYAVLKDPDNNEIWLHKTRD